MSEKTIGFKITLTCTVLVAFTLVLAAAALLGMNRLSADIHRLQVDSIPGQYTIGRLDTLAGEAARKMGDELLDLVTNAGNDKERTQKESAASWSKYQDELKAYEETITQAEDRQLFGSVRPASDRYIQSWKQVLSLAAASKMDEALRLQRSETAPAFDALRKTIDDLVQWNHVAADQVAASSAGEASTAMFWNWTVSLSAALAGAILAFFVVRSINRLLRRMAAEIAEGAMQIASAAGQVSASSQSLAQGTSEQAASLEETSASSTEINSMARRNTENTRQAAHLMSGFQEKFGDARSSVERMVVSMGEINSQSDKISKIIKVIDEIAFQTNILALNAAVEAARAGVAGMGFAVVADEVRNLAQRSAQAARDTALLIEGSIEKSKDGKGKVDQLTAVIRTIIDESTKVNTLVDEVNLGSQEQARGIDQIARAITQMEQVTQKSAAGAEESAAAAEELNAQSHTMQDIAARLAKIVGSAA